MTSIQVKLKSPFNDDCIATINCQFNNTLNNEAYDIIKIIRFIAEDYPHLNVILSEHEEAVKSYESMKSLLEAFNKWSDENKCVFTEQRVGWRQASNNLIKYLMLLIYNRAVLDPDKLNQYEPFSPQVYGETSFDLIDQMLKKVPLNEDHIFMDLGSGVGNVVLHVAAVTKCKHCYGFEKADWPAFYATKMEKEFKFWMKFFDKSYSEFNLYKADFLSDEEFIDGNRTKTMNEYVKEIINESNLIFVNNYAFGAEVDHQLKLRFCNMLEGAIIVSSKPFCSLNFRINSRNLNDIGTILNIDFEPLNGHVSWTDKPINYYFHKIDRTLLEKYFESKKNPPSYHNENEKTNHKHNLKSHSPSSSSSSSVSSQSESPSQSPSSTSSSTSSESSSASLCSNSSSLKIKKRALSKQNHSNEPSEIRSRRKSKKRKQASADQLSTQMLSTSNSLIAKKRAKLNVKKTAKLNLNKDQLTTLNKMHNEVASHSLKTTKTNQTNKAYNNAAITSLRDENLSSKLLKDCKISPKLLMNKTISTSNTADKSSSSGTDLLGKEVKEAIDSYLNKLRTDFVSYLTHMKTSSEFREKIKMEITNELNKKAQNLLIIEKKEKTNSDLLKQDVMFLKKRAEEVGISCLESPQQLMDHAKEMLEKHHNLLEKMANVQKKINSLQQQHQQQKDTKTELDTLKSLNTSNKNTFDSLKKLSSYFNTNQRLDLSNLIKNSADECFTNQILLSQNSNDLRSVESNRSTDETMTATERGDYDNYDIEEDMEEDSDYMNSGETNKETTTHTNAINNSNNSNNKSKKSTSKPAVIITKTSQTPTAVTSSHSPVLVNYDTLLNENRDESSKDMNQKWRSFKIPKKSSQGPQTPPGSPSLSNSTQTTSSYSINDNNTNTNTNTNTTTSPPPPPSSSQQHQHLSTSAVSLKMNSNSALINSTETNKYSCLNEHSTTVKHWNAPSHDSNGYSTTKNYNYNSHQYQYQHQYHHHYTNYSHQQHQHQHQLQPSTFNSQSHQPNKQYYHPKKKYMMENSATTSSPSNNSTRTYSHAEQHFKKN